MREIRKERRQYSSFLVSGHVSDWLLLLIEGKDNGKGESVATSIQQWMLCIAYVHVHIWIRRRREGCLLR